jgi:hypothetical protein
MSRFIIDRKLPERSKLQFFFPVAAKGNKYYVVELPFYENIKIKEDKKARYQKYSLISRSSNLYSYLGADSRELSLDFNMTLPHILETYSNITLDRYLNYYDLDNTNTQRERDKFLNPLKPKKTPEGIAYRLGTTYTKSLAKESARFVLQNALYRLNSQEREYFSNKYGVEAEVNKLRVASNFPEISYIKTTDVQTKSNPDPLSLDPKYKIIDTIIYWTNIIRSSVVNNAMNPIYGPPVIRLRHGIMYQDIPCICTSYSIDFDEGAGYDIDTLLPRSIKISLKLEEFRTGDFTEFNPRIQANSIKRDNLAGWEAVLLKETHSMDPGYSDIR